MNLTPEEDGLRKCTEELQSRKDIEMICGDKDDIIFCYNTGFFTCCYNNMPCMKEVKNIEIFNKLVDDIKKAQKKRDQKGANEDYYDEYEYYIK